MARTVVATAVWLTGFPSLVLAHGGALTGEQVRPMALSGVLAFCSYWVAMLWPKRQNKDAPPRGPFRKTQVSSRPLRSPLKKSSTLKQVPRAGGYSCEPDSVSNR